MHKPKIILWFRNDLRLDDNEMIIRAVEQEAHIVPVYCFDPRMYTNTSFGFPKTGFFRGQFLLESVADLRESLRQRKSDLIVLKGYPEVVIPALAKEIKATAVYCQKEVTGEDSGVEVRIKLQLKTIHCGFETFWGFTLYHIEDLPFRINELPDVFSHFVKGLEQGTVIREPFEPVEKLPSLKNIDVGEIPTIVELKLTASPIESEPVMKFHGGESSGLSRMRHYITESSALLHYRDTRNSLMGVDTSSKLSPWLSLGCISPRRIKKETVAFERNINVKDAAYWFIFELLWRDFFRFIALKYGDQIFTQGGIKGARIPIIEDSHSRLTEAFFEEQQFELWKTGKTGFPLIDANMHELAQTGYMSNRGRQVTASFLAKELNINWLKGAEYFESMLIDYDVCSNYGNWMYVAGVGNDPREHRRFNVLKQAETYDSEGKYVKRWVPELSSIPQAFIHQPHKLPKADQERLGIKIGIHYPSPMIEEEKGQMDLDFGDNV